MSNIEEIKLENSNSQTSKLYLDLIPKTRNKNIKKNHNINNNNNYSLKQLKFHQNKTLINNKIPNKTEPNQHESLTKKIDYRYYKLYPIKEIIHFSLDNVEKETNELFWFVAYDNLIKTKKILKILNSDTKGNEKPIYTENNLKIKNMKIQDFQIFFVKGFDKPFIRPNNDSFILTKLYLLSIKEINKILNYINKAKDKVNIDKYINLDTICNENNFWKFINIKHKNEIDDDISYPYCYFYQIGKYMNKSMLLFTNTFNYINEETNNKSVLYSLPSSKKLYKLIKQLIKLFPQYSPNYFIEYLINRNLYKNCEEKRKEILNLLPHLNMSIPNRNLLNKVLRETINGIQTNSSISGSSIPIDSDESSKQKINCENNKRISISIFNNINQIGMKNSLKSNKSFSLNGRITSINYLSTNQTLQPNFSIQTLKNSFKNFPFITIPLEINNVKKERDSFGVYLINSTNTQNNNCNFCLAKKEKTKNKNLNNKNFKENEALKNSAIKEKIDINNILDKNKIEFKRGIKSPSNGLIIKKNKKKDKVNKNNNNKKYHTPKKKKKIKYYK